MFRGVTTASLEIISKSILLHPYRCMRGRCFVWNAQFAHMHCGWCVMWCNRCRNHWWVYFITGETAKITIQSSFKLTNEACITCFVRRLEWFFFVNPIYDIPVVLVCMLMSGLLILMPYFRTLCRIKSPVFALAITQHSTIRSYVLV